MAASYPLYGGLPPHERPETSVAAAVSLLGHVAVQRDRVLRYVASCGSYGAIDDEIERALDLPHQSASARRRELVLLGEVVPTIERRRTRAGRRAIVHVVATSQPGLPL